MDQPNDKVPDDAVVRGFPSGEYIYPRLADLAENNGQPLVDGAEVEIGQHLINQVEAAIEVELPDEPPDDGFLKPNADDLTDEAITEQVRDTYLAEPIVAMILTVSALVKTAYRGRRDEFLRPHDRLLDRQRTRPLEIPASKSTTSKRRSSRELASFWMNWSGLALTGLAAALGCTLNVEVLYQVTVFMESSFGMTQSFFGALGFVWSSTMGVVIMSHWRSRVLASDDADDLTKSMSRLGFTLAWLGLAGLGFLMGAIHAFQEGSGVLLPTLQSLQTMASVLTLGIVCVAIEKGCEHVWKKAYAWTHVENEELAEIDERNHPNVSHLITVDQLGNETTCLDERLERKVRSISRQWMARRDQFREENKQARELEAINEQLEAASEMAAKAEELKRAAEARLKKRGDSDAA